MRPLGLALLVFLGCSDPSTAAVDATGGTGGSPGTGGEFGGAPGTGGILGTGGIDAGSTGGTGGAPAMTCPVYTIASVQGMSAVITNYPQNGASTLCILVGPMHGQRFTVDSNTGWSGQSPTVDSSGMCDVYVTRNFDEGNCGIYSVSGTVTLAP